MGTIATVCPQARNSTAFNKILCHSRSQAKIIKACKWKYTERKIYRMPRVSKAILTSALNWIYGPLYFNHLCTIKWHCFQNTPDETKNTALFLQLKYEGFQEKKKKRRRNGICLLFSIIFIFIILEHSEEDLGNLHVTLLIKPQWAPNAASTSHTQTF